MSEQFESNTSMSIQCLNKLLQSNDIKDKTTALTALYQLSQNPHVIEDMVKQKIHFSLFRLLGAFRQNGDKQDCVEGEEENGNIKSKKKLSPPLINQILQLLTQLVFADDFDQVPTESFKRIINIINDEKYRKQCQQNVYTLLQNACISSRVSPLIRECINDKIKLELPRDKECWPHFLRLMSKLTQDSEDCEDFDFLKRIISSRLFKQLLNLLKEKGNDIIKIYTFDILWSLSIWNVNESDKYCECDWICNYNDLFCQFVLDCFSNESCKKIKNDIIMLTEQMTNGMDEKWGNKKKKKKKKKGTDSVVPNEADIEKWNGMKQKLITQINTNHLAMDLYVRIFQSNQVQLDDDDNDNKEEEMTENERRKKHKCVFSKVSTSELCGLIIDFWLPEFETGDLVKISEFIGIDFHHQIVDNLMDFEYAKIGFLNEIISESMIEISCSQWQKVWDFGCGFIENDNEKSKEKRQNDESMNDQRDDNEDIVNLLRLTMNDISSKELKVSCIQIAELLKLHQRISNCQQRMCQFEIAIDCNDLMRIDLLHVDDMNEYQQNINQILTNLFKFEVVEQNEEHQRSILNAMYEDVIALNKNIEFVDTLKKSFDEMLDVEMPFNELLEGWNGSVSMQIGFETAQLILDIMTMNDEYIKLSMNKHKFKHILKEYKMCQLKWKEIKDLSDKWNENMDETQQIHWDAVDLISREVDECIVNISNFIETQLE